MSMLRVQNLYKTYPSFALKDVSFSLEAGRIMGLIGKNGAGKSTTLKAMLGMVSPDSGKVEMLGRDFYADEAQCKQALGVVLGGIQLLDEDHIAVLDLILLAASFDNCEHFLSCLYYSLATVRRSGGA